MLKFNLDELKSKLDYFKSYIGEVVMAYCDNSCTIFQFTKDSLCNNLVFVHLVDVFAATENIGDSNFLNGIWVQMKTSLEVENSSFAEIPLNTKILTKEQWETQENENFKRIKSLKGKNILLWEYYKSVAWISCGRDGTDTVWGLSFEPIEEGMETDDELYVEVCSSVGKVIEVYPRDSNSVRLCIKMGCTHNPYSFDYIEDNINVESKPNDNGVGVFYIIAPLNQKISFLVEDHSKNKPQNVVKRNWRDIYG